MAGRTIDIPGLIQAHLAKHPDQTPYALEMLTRHEEAQAERRERELPRVWEKASAPRLRAELTG